MKIAMLQFDERVDDENINSILNINKKYCEIHGYDHIFKALKEEDTHQHKLDEYLILKNNENILKLNVYDYRIYMIEQYMNDYDYLVYCDTDLLINNPTIKIEDLIDANHELFMFTDHGKLNSTFGLLMIANSIVIKCKEENQRYLKNPLNDLMNIKNYDWPAYERLCNIVINPDGLASGFMIINCHSKLLKSFIEDFKRFYPLFVNGNFDQGCIATLLRRPKYQKNA